MVRGCGHRLACDYGTWLGLLAPSRLTRGQGGRERTRSRYERNNFENLRYGGGGIDASFGSARLARPVRASRQEGRRVRGGGSSMRGDEFLGSPCAGRAPKQSARTSRTICQRSSSPSRCISARRRRSRRSRAARRSSSSRSPIRAALVAARSPTSRQTRRCAQRLAAGRVARARPRPPIEPSAKASQRACFPLREVTCRDR